MPQPSSRLSGLIARAWRIDRPLTVATLLMLLAFVAALAGLWFDPRTIVGAPAWLKPAKFGIATAIYDATLIAILAWLPAWSRTRWWGGWTTAVVSVLEIAIIGLQAWRGTTSHFNAATSLDGMLFSIMGVGIVSQTLAAVALAVALWRQRFADGATGWALRLGMTIAVIGGASGGLMTAPTRAQLTILGAGQTMPIVGAHTVGAADGGPGLPGTGWSLAHGDLRVPHFVGLHAVQVLPLILLTLPRRLSPRARSRVVVVAAVSYLALFTLLLWQALRAEALLRPGPTTTAAFAAWTLLSIVAVLGAAWGAAPSTLRNGTWQSVKGY